MVWVVTVPSKLLISNYNNVLKTISWDTEREGFKYGDRITITTVVRHGGKNVGGGQSGDACKWSVPQKK